MARPRANVPAIPPIRNDNKIQVLVILLTLSSMHLLRPLGDIIIACLLTVLDCG